jgi:hypothetical protein
MRPIIPILIFLCVLMDLKQIWYTFEQGSAFLALFLYGMALFIVGGDFLSYENNHRNESILFKFNQIIHEIWLFIILCYFLALFVPTPAFEVF